MSWKTVGPKPYVATGLFVACAIVYACADEPLAPPAEIYGIHLRTAGTLPDDTRLKVEIRDDGEFEVEGKGAGLGGIDPNSSLFFSVQIGNDLGESTIAFDDDGEF